MTSETTHDHGPHTHGARDGSQHGQHGQHGHGAHGPNGGDGQGTAGTITAIHGTTFVIATKQGDLTVQTDAATNYHTPGVSPEAKRAGYDGYHALTFAALKVGQRIGVTGERSEDGTLHARRVHLPKP